MAYRFTKMEQSPIISRRQAEEDALQKGIEGLVVGLAAGLMIGTAITLLVAPKSGKQARQDIMDASYLGACEVKDKTAAVGSKIKESTQDLTEKVKEKLANTCCCENQAEADEPCC
ncbi:MAG: YtxH domain-containing protein, partial [Clostridiales bacterium]